MIHDIEKASKVSLELNKMLKSRKSRLFFLFSLANQRKKLPPPKKK